MCRKERKGQQEKDGKEGNDSENKKESTAR